MLLAGTEFRLAVSLGNFGFTGHAGDEFAVLKLTKYGFEKVETRVLLGTFLERHPERTEQKSRFVVARRRCDHRNVEPLHGFDTVRVHFRKHHLLVQAETIVPPTIKCFGVEPAKVSHPRQNDGDEPVEKLVHPMLSQGHATTDFHPLAKFEVGDRSTSPRNLSLLAGDQRQLADDFVKHLAVLDRLAHPHADDDLLQLGE